MTKYFRNSRTAVKKFEIFNRIIAINKYNMKLSEVKDKLTQLDRIAFQLPNGDLVPGHFHVTEVGKITKNFIDCGKTQKGIIRNANNKFLCTR